MRKIDILANEKYNGDTKLALETLIEAEQSIDEYVDELTKEEAIIAFSKIMNFTADKHFGGIDNLQANIQMDMQLDSMELTREDLIKAKKNPYKAKFMKSFFRTLLVEGGVIGLALFGPDLGIDSSVVGLLSSVLTGIMSFDLAQNLLNYFKFNKLKKKLEKNPEVYNPQLYENLDMEEVKGRNL